jgi:small subunit ribosomal protein S33
MASTTPFQLASLTKIRCSIFQTSYNPTSARTGAKYLRGRLRGPGMLKYYPEAIDMAQVQRMYKAAGILPPGAPSINLPEAQRLEDVEARRARGKATPTKTKEKGTLTMPVISIFHLTTHAFLQATASANNASGSTPKGRIVIALFHIITSFSFHDCTRSAKLELNSHTQFLSVSCCTGTSPHIDEWQSHINER